MNRKIVLIALEDHIVIMDFNWFLKKFDAEKELTSNQKKRNIKSWFYYITDQNKVNPQWTGTIRSSLTLLSPAFKLQQENSETVATFFAKLQSKQSCHLRDKFILLL